MPLIKDGRIVADAWTAVGAEDAVPPAGPVILPLARWLAEREPLAGRNSPLGVRLESHESVAEIAPDVGRLSLIALAFPTFRDGRAYSAARLLRERYGFKGELRAVGNVLRDQFLFMLRCGFDAFEVADETAAAGWGEATREFSVFYQPTGDGRLTAPLARRRARAAE